MASRITTWAQAGSVRSAIARAGLTAGELPVMFFERAKRALEARASTTIFEATNMYTRRHIDLLNPRRPRREVSCGRHVDRQFKALVKWDDRSGTSTTARQGALGPVRTMHAAASRR